MASHRKPRPGGTRGPGLRGPALATAAVTSVAVLSQTAEAVSADDGRPSLEEIEKKIDELYRLADPPPEEEPAARPRARADETRQAEARRAARLAKAREARDPFPPAPDVAASLLAEYPQDHFAQNRVMNRLASRVKDAAERGRNARSPRTPDAGHYDVQAAKAAIQYKLATTRELLSRLTSQADSRQTTPGHPTPLTGRDTLGRPDTFGGSDTLGGAHTLGGSDALSGSVAFGGSHTFAESEALGGPDTFGRPHPHGRPDTLGGSDTFGGSHTLSGSHTFGGSDALGVPWSATRDPQAALDRPQSEATAPGSIAPVTTAPGPIASGSVTPGSIAPGTAAAAATASAAALPAAHMSPGSQQATKAGKAVAFARAQLGKPYVSGASGPGSYDCSGLTQAAWKAAGVTLPRSAQAQAAAGAPVPLTDARAGDLVFFHADGSHVGLCTGNGMMIHAPRPGGYVREAPVDLSGGSVIHSVVRPA